MTDEPVEVRFRADDGAPLGGTLFPATRPRGAALVAGGTGVPARFYARFAADLADHGWTALTFDYRGIGASLVGHVRDCDARKQDWGQLDLPAALAAPEERAPGLPLGFVGHSAGGQLLGLMDGVGRLDRVVQVACSSGHFGGLGRRYRLLGPLLLGVYGRLSVRLLGYAKTRWLGWGEDLPAGVARQWAEWCSTPGYVESSFGDTVERHFYDEVRCPLVNLTVSDDPIATEENVRDLLRLFPNADVVVEHVDVWPRVRSFLEGDADRARGVLDGAGIDRDPW